MASSSRGCTNGAAMVVLEINLETGVPVGSWRVTRQRVWEVLMDHFSEEPHDPKSATARECIREANNLPRCHGGAIADYGDGGIYVFGANKIICALAFARYITRRQKRRSHAKNRTRKITG